MGLSKWCSCFGKGNAVDADATEKLVTNPQMKESRPKSSTITPIQNDDENGAGGSNKAPSKAELKAEKNFAAAGGAVPPSATIVDTTSGNQLVPIANPGVLTNSSAAQDQQSKPADGTKPTRDLKVPSSSTTPTPPFKKPAKTRSSSAGSGSSASSSAMEHERHEKAESDEEEEEEEDEGPPKPIAAFGGDDNTAAVGVRGLLNRAKIKKVGGGGGGGDGKTSVMEMDLRNGDEDDHGRGAGGGGGIGGRGASAGTDLEPRRLNPKPVLREREESSHVMDVHPFQLPEEDDIP
ncbi:hypothetical protein BDZ88DRAFT_21343 [Geranomyces variabilis]|nr:hypothetical protein BDZ88DRAFT_21343 [Geranomyces variabilis]KAJ3138632.1 hypothetical protein HDU90_001075 [Geranomyces variabilis]